MELGEVLGKCFDSDQERNTAPELEQITIRDSKGMNQSESEMATTDQKKSFITVCASIRETIVDLTLNSFLDKVDLIKI